MYQIGTHQGKIQLFTVKSDFCTCYQLVIFHGKRIFLLHQGNQLLIHGFLPKFNILERHRSDLLLKILSVRGLVKLPGILQSHALKHGKHLVIIFMLLLIKFIGGINIVTNVCNRIQSAYPVAQCIIFLVNLKLLLPVFRSIELLHDLVHFLLNSVEIHSFVRHVLKFHCVTSFPLSYLCYIFTLYMILTFKASDVCYFDKKSKN